MPPAARPSLFHVWWTATRPKTLGLAVSPVVLGTAYAWTVNGTLLHPEAPLVILVCAVAIQVGTNLFNDAQDFVNGTDGDARLGPPRVTALGWALPHQVSAAGLTAFLIALLGGLHLIGIGGWPIFFGGLAALWAGYLYSHGPYPVSHSPFGEVVVLVFFGLFAVGGTVYLITGLIPSTALMWGGLIGLPASAVLLVNNVRDQVGDRAAGRRTLAVLVSARAAQWLYGAFIALPLAGIGVMVFSGIAPLGALAGFAVLPLALRAIRTFAATPPGPALNGVLAATVKYQALLAISIAIGLVLPRL